jgi:hypothetical protein
MSVTLLAFGAASTFAFSQAAGDMRMVVVVVATSRSSIMVNGR